jgi:hypothetical protein
VQLRVPARPIIGVDGAAVLGCLRGECSRRLAGPDSGLRRPGVCRRRPCPGHDRRFWLRFRLGLWLLLEDRLRLWARPLQPRRFRIGLWRPLRLRLWLSLRLWFPFSLGLRLQIWLSLGLRLQFWLWLRFRFRLRLGGPLQPRRLGPGFWLRSQPFEKAWLWERRSRRLWLRERTISELTRRVLRLGFWFRPRFWFRPWLGLGEGAIGAVRLRVLRLGKRRFGRLGLLRRRIDEARFGEGGLWEGGLRRLRKRALAEPRIREGGLGRLGIREGRFGVDAGPPGLIGPGVRVISARKVVFGPGGIVRPAGIAHAFLPRVRRRTAAS